MELNAAHFSFNVEKFNHLKIDILHEKFKIIYCSMNSSELDLLKVLLFLSVFCVSKITMIVAFHLLGNLLLYKINSFLYYCITFLFLKNTKCNIGTRVTQK